MRYYPAKKVNTNNIQSKLNMYTCFETNEKLLLTQYGMFKYTDDTLMVCKINQMDKGNTSIKKYIKDMDFIITPNKWGKVDKRYRLPFVNEIIEVKTLVFSPRKGSKFKFVVEKTNNGVTDYYFKSPEKYDNHSLKEDIGSFLDKLM